MEEFETLKEKQFDPEVVDALVRFIQRSHSANENRVD